MNTKKTFETVARIIKQSAPADHIVASTDKMDRGFASGCASACERIANGLADEFARENPRFDRARFLGACGVADLNG